MQFPGECEDFGVTLGLGQAHQDGCGRLRLEK
jgi:hypothetical protein